MVVLFGGLSTHNVHEAALPMPANVKACQLAVFVSGVKVRDGSPWRLFVHCPVAGEQGRKQELSFQVRMETEYIDLSLLP